MKLLSFLLIRSLQKIVEYVIVSFVSSLTAYPRFLQQIFLNNCSVNHTIFFVVNLDEFTKSTGRKY